MTAESPIPRRLRELRAKTGKTQQDIASAAGLSVSIVAQIERGVNIDPKISTLQKLADALGVGVEKLIAGE